MRQPGSRPRSSRSRRPVRRRRRGRRSGCRGWRCRRSGTGSGRSRRCAATPPHPAPVLSRVDRAAVADLELGPLGGQIVERPVPAPSCAATISGGTRPSSRPAARSAPTRAVPAAASVQFGVSTNTPPSWRERTWSRNSAEPSVPSKPSSSTWSASCAGVIPWTRVTVSAANPASGSGSSAASSPPPMSRITATAMTPKAIARATARRRAIASLSGPLESSIPASIVFSAADGRHGGDEVRRHVGRRTRGPQARRDADRRRTRERQAGGRGAVRAGQDDRRSGRRRLRDLRAPAGA